MIIIGLTNTSIMSHDYHFIFVVRTFLIEFRPLIPLVVFAYNSYHPDINKPKSLIFFKDLAKCHLLSEALLICLPSLLAYFFLVLYIP